MIFCLSILLMKTRIRVDFSFYLYYNSVIPKCSRVGIAWSQRDVECLRFIMGSLNAHKGVLFFDAPFHEI